MSHVTGVDDLLGHLSSFDFLPSWLEVAKQAAPDAQHTHSFDDAVWWVRTGRSASPRTRCATPSPTRT